MNNMKLMIFMEEAMAKRRKPVSAKVSRLLLEDIDEKIQGYSQNARKAKDETRLYDIVMGYVKRLGGGKFLKKNGNVSEARFYTYAYIDKSTWSEMKWGLVETSKKTLLKLVIALELNEEEAVAFLQSGRSGFDLDDPQDQVVLAIIDVRKAGFSVTVDDAVEILDFYSRNGKASFVSIYEIPGDKNGKTSAGGRTKYR